MKKYLIPLVMIGTMTASFAAFAADQATGEIKTLNAAKHQFSLTDGETFTAGKQVNLRDFQVGQTVTVTYDIRHGKSVASSVAMAEDQVFQKSEEGGKSGGASKSR